MSTLPPPVDPSDDDADEQYRRASELDPSRPSEATRRAVLAHAARLAAERARRGTRRRWLSRMGAELGWRPAIAGTIAAALLAGIVIAPQFLAPTGPPESQHAPAVVPPPTAGAPAAAPAAALRAPEERTGPEVPADVASRPVASRPVAAAPSAPAAAATADEAVTARQPEPSGARARVAAKPAAEGVTSGAPTSRYAISESRAIAPAAAAARVAPVRPPPPARPTVSGDIAGGPDALRRAAAAGDLEALAAQLARGTDIDARDAEGRTALLLATLNGQTDAVALLLAHGADPSAADAHGTTPLQAAIGADDRQIVAMLRRYGAR